MHRTVCAVPLAMVLVGFGSASASVMPQPSKPIMMTSQMVLLSPAPTAAQPPAADDWTSLRATTANARYPFETCANPARWPFRI